MIGRGLASRFITLSNIVTVSNSSSRISAFSGLSAYSQTLAINMAKQPTSRLPRTTSSAIIAGLYADGQRGVCSILDTVRKASRARPCQLLTSVQLSTGENEPSRRVSGPGAPIRFRRTERNARSRQSLSAPHTADMRSPRLAGTRCRCRFVAYGSPAAIQPSLAMRSL